MKENTTEKKNTVWRAVVEWITAFVVVLAFFFLLNTFVIVNAYVPSGSMEPTIETRSRMLGFRLTSLFREYERGDIIIFRFPDDESQIFVKRIVGLPGDTVEIKEGSTYINGEKYDETYLSVIPFNNDMGPWTVPEGCYFVMGDNRNSSNDSRYWNNHFVSKDKVLGTAFFVYWPFSDFGTVQ